MEYHLSFTSKRPTIFISTIASIISIVFQCTTSWSLLESARVHWSPLDYVGQCKVLIASVIDMMDVVQMWECSRKATETRGH